MRSSSIGCQARFESSSSSLSHSEISCILSDYNESMSVCVCDLSVIKLNLPVKAGPVSFSIMSIERSVLRDFVSTWETVPSLTSGKASGSWVVLATLGGLVGMFGLMMALGIHLDAHEKKSLSVSVAPVTLASAGGGASGSQIVQAREGASNWFSIGISPDPSDLQTPNCPLSESASLDPDAQLLEEILPSVFKSNSLWTKFKEEMKIYHRWLGIVFYYSPEFPRLMRVLSLFSSIVVMLFVQSVTYNIADPDDGSCEACESESRCLSLRSTLNTRQSRCYWKTDSDSVTFSSSSDGSCHFREIGGDMTRMFVVVLISMIVSAPFALGVQYLIVNVLSKRTIDEEQLEKETQKVSDLRIEKLMSVRQKHSDRLKEPRVPRPLSLGDIPTTDGTNVESLPGSSSDDLRNLQAELTAHYKYLKARSATEIQAREFKGK
jgi:hypothetical protein